MTPITSSPSRTPPDVLFIVSTSGESERQDIGQESDKKKRLLSTQLEPCRDICSAITANTGRKSEPTDHIPDNLKITVHKLKEHLRKHALQCLVTSQHALA